MNERVKQVTTLVAVFLGVLGPAVSNFILSQPGSSETALISDDFLADVTIVPADYAFAIWAPILLGFMVFAVYQALPAQRDNPRFAKARLWVGGSALLNSLWTLVFENQQFVLSAVVITALLVTALVIHQKLEIGRTSVSGFERWLRVPFSLYAAWLTVATVINVAGALEFSGWNGFGLSFTAWGVVMLVVASAIGLLARFGLNDPVYGGVFIWAFLAIMVERSGILPVVITAGILAAVFALSIILPRLRSGRRSTPLSA